MDGQCSVLFQQSHLGITYPSTEPRVKERFKDNNDLEPKMSKEQKHGRSVP